jgi:hypothetical protein
MECEGDKGSKVRKLGREDGERIKRSDQVKK